LRLHSDTRPHVGKIAGLQKGLVWVQAGQTLVEEGYGFGCPIVEYNGEPAAMAVGLPDYNQILYRLNGSLAPFGWLRFLTQRRRITQLRVWALGVKRKFQGLGLDALLYYESRRGAEKLGYDWAEVSWILEDNEAIIRPITMMRGRRYKTYRMYDRPL